MLLHTPDTSWQEPARIICPVVIAGAGTAVEVHVQYGFVVSGGDVDVLVALAPMIEVAARDALLIADEVYGTNPWVSLAAMAMQT